MVLPSFDVNGFLPPGVHRATWEEVVATFGWNARRRELLGGLRRALDDLRAAGCRMVWLDGSFVTAKDLPGDFDLCWDLEGVEVSRLHPALRDDLHPPRSIQKATYGGDVLPNVGEGGSGRPFLEFFQQDAETGLPRGIVLIELQSETS